MWLRTRKGRKKLSVRFLAKLKTRHPHLYERAVKMNQRDSFVMWNKRDKYKHRFVKKGKKKQKTANADGLPAQQQEDAKDEESSDDTISSSSSDESSSSNESESSSDSDSSSASSSDADFNGEHNS